MKVNLERPKTQNPCQICTAKCCRNYTVSLTAADLEKLFRTKTDDIYKHIAAIDATGFDPKLVPRVKLTKENGKEGDFILCLVRDRKETCSFLGKGNLCTIYENRPRNCRIYPFRLDEKGGLKYVEKYRCPVDWKLNTKAAKSFEKDITIQKKEVHEYKVICDAWNGKTKEHRELNEFIEFVRQFKQNTDGHNK
ncbi:YkgJ family cysteine cluster protein [Candidatus Micrarchaeota archaeon]|nr:YkgJ family cysteine cluster protein [Candidatus Micrarchaeota archaeon]